MTEIMIPEDLQRKLNELKLHYNQLAKKYGYSPHSTQQSSLETQEKRFEVLVKMIGDLNNSKILDFGCGTGQLFSYLINQGYSVDYVGFDISEELLRLAKENHPSARFELVDIFSQQVNETFDWVFISGVFNNNIGYNQDFMKNTLFVLFDKVDKGIVFNALTCYVDYKDPDLYYFDPGWVFDFCKSNLTTHVVLNHAYQIKPGVIPFEFSVKIEKSDFHPVKRYV